MFGNYIGDGVKGSVADSFPESIVRGVQFHRFIDSYTDTHEEVREAKKLFYPTQAKFSGVVVDVLFDHLLAQKWKGYHAMELDQFAAHCYHVVQANYDLMPTRSKRFYGYMTSNNILENYATTEGIAQVFRGMDTRTRFDSNMANAMQDLDRYREKLDGYFDRFFPDLVEQCSAWKKRH